MNRFELNKLTDYKDDAILDEIRRIAQINGHRPLTRSAYQALKPKVHWSTILNHFGTWEAALKGAGLDHLHSERFLTPSEVQLKRGRAMTDEELIFEIQRVHTLHGSRELRARDFDASSVTCSQAVRERFGRWQNGLEKAGIEKPSLGKRYTDTECYENIAQLWNHYGRQPNYSELKSPPSVVGPKAYSRWGGWRKALKAFVEWVNSDEQNIDDLSDGEKLQKRESSETTKARPSLEDRREIPLRLKWIVHVRDNFRCLACGRNPPQHGVILHADHVVPWADGGKTTLENLQTLCEACNLSKSKSFADVRAACRLTDE